MNKLLINTINHHRAISPILFETMCMRGVKHSNLDIIVIFCAISISFIIAAVCFLIAGANEPNVHKIKCDELNCTVNSIDGHCYAKLAQMIGYDFQEVKCDKQRDNEMYFVLPCDVGKDGKIDINCDIENEKKSNDVKSSIVLLLCGVVIGCAAVTLAIRLMLARGEIMKSEKNNTEKNNTEDNNTEDNNTDETNIRNTGSNYAQFDKE